MTTWWARSKTSAPAKASKFEAVDIDIQAGDLESAMAEILDKVKRKDEIYIDATGGPRDANFILVMLMQALQFRGPL